MAFFVHQADEVTCVCMHARVCVVCIFKSTTLFLLAPCFKSTSMVPCDEFQARSHRLLKNTVHTLLYSLTHHTTVAWKPSRSLPVLLLRVIHVPSTYLGSSYAAQNQLIISPCLGGFSLSSLSPDSVSPTRDCGIPSQRQGPPQSALCPQGLARGVH